MDRQQEGERLPPKGKVGQLRIDEPDQLRL